MNKRIVGKMLAGVVVAAASGVVASAVYQANDRQDGRHEGGRRARNVIFFVGDGMGVSTVAATRIYSVGVDGKLVLDQLPYTAFSRTYSADSITADSAPTMTAMMTGVNTNQGVIGFDDKTEVRDFLGNGDGQRPWTLLELAKQRDMTVGVVSTARITHATPAATYSHINNRDNENAIALQALPGDTTYNRRLGDGIDLLFGGGRSFFVPQGIADEEGSNGSRADKRDLRTAFVNAGYTYVWRNTEFQSLKTKDLPVIGLFESSHMEYEFDRASDVGGEPSLTDMTTKAIRLLEQASKRGNDGYFLMVEGGRIDHAHHEGNALRALHDAQELDQAIGAAVQNVDLRDTLIIVSADHSHVFNIAGYPLRAANELKYSVPSADPTYTDGLAGNGVLDIVYDVNPATGHVSPSLDRDGVPYTVLGYLNGPGFRGRFTRLDPRVDPFPGRNGQVPNGPAGQSYFQESAVPLGSETHAGEDVGIYAIGAGAEMVRGTVKNTFIFEVMKAALGIR